MSTVEPDEDEADKERRAIVARYDRGYQADETEEWEDASYIVYQVTDRYGFMHKKPLANDRDHRLLIQERERGLKWKKMYDRWEKYVRTEKLRKRVYKGIPDSMRSSVWKALLEIDHVPSKTILYQEFRARARLYSPDIRQIDLDVNRTYRDHIMFRDRYGIKQQDLFHVLAAYSMYNQEVGYCQGMSGVAALLLMYLNEEDAFWALSILVTNSKKHSMHGFFIPGFPKLKRFQDHHETILKKFSPKLFKHLEKEGVYTSLYTLKWFMQCFLDRVPFPMTLRIWDVFLLEGDKILTAMAYSLMKMHRKTFVKLPMEDIVEFLQEEMSAYPYNLDQIMEMLQDSIFELKKGGMVFPPAPSDLEFPRLKPGSSPFNRNTHETASARARKSRQKDKIIEIPTVRPLSPKSPASDDSLNRPVSGSLQSPVSHSGSSLGRLSNRSRNSAETRREVFEKRVQHASSPETPPTHADPPTISHVGLRSETDVGSPVDPADRKGRVALVLSSTEIAKFNQDLKSSYVRSRRQNDSNPATPDASSSQPYRHSEGGTPERERSRGHPSTISLPGTVTIEPNLSSPNGAKPRGSARGNRHTGSLPKYSSPVSPVQNGAAPADITHAPVWQNEGPEGSMQFTLTQVSNRPMTFV